VVGAGTENEQTVIVPGTSTLDVIVPSLAKSLAAVQEQRRALEAQIEALLEAHPLAEVLTSMPGIGVRTAAVLLATVGDGSSFPSAAHLASYAGLAPATKSSETSIHGEHAQRGGNRQLKRATFPLRVRRPARSRLPHLLRPLPSPR
jgi:transposase